MRPQPIDAFIMMSTNMMDVIIGNSGGVEGSNSIITYGHGKKVRGARGHLEKKRQRDKRFACKFLVLIPT